MTLVEILLKVILQQLVSPYSTDSHEHFSQTNKLFCLLSDSDSNLVSSEAP